ncbi:hypothetical protein HX882_33355 [Pseudomonas gingeri]|uniref:Fluoroacetyl-CoA-specific thioesterase-like domain-containing protein n=1 Tax=Pseudomonas gingeri TaxID=117681 RepID=A0A7Y7XIZ9_9PSED|nr:hypothetical protein [Pseudomonas gingeri]NWC00764.1 hypothetical protein [Pseudomonas gingeri]
MTELMGRAGEILHTVTPSDLATHWNNDIPVLATPILLWLSELAAMRALEDLLPTTAMTLGIAHDSRHLAPTPLGFTISVSARVKAVTGKYVTFDVKATDGFEVILSGTHTRAIIEREKFEERVADKSTGARP